MLSAAQVADCLNTAGAVAQEFGADPTGYFDAQGVDGQAIYNAAVGVVRTVVADTRSLKELRDALGLDVENVEQARLVAGTMVAMYLAGINGGIQLGRKLSEDDE